MANLEPAVLPPDEQQKSGWAAAGLGIGIVGLLLAFIPLMFQAACTLSAVAVILSIIAYYKLRQGKIGVFVGCAGLVVSGILQFF